MQVPQNVLVVLSTMRFEGTLAFLNAGQLDRKLYVRVDETLQAAGGKWNRSKKAHVFDCDAEEAIDRVITTGEVTTKQDLGFFPTPIALAERMVEEADIQPGDRVLEPSAGTGRIVNALLARTKNVVAVERDLKMRKALALLNCSVSGIEDFLDFSDITQGGFDHVVMNPPFCRVGKGDHIAHVIHAFSLLRSGGVLVSILPSSVMFRDDKKHFAFRTFVEKHGHLGELPPLSFRASGTDVNTCFAKMVKP